MTLWHAQVSAALSDSSDALAWIPAELRGNREIMLKVVQQSWVLRLLGTLVAHCHATGDSAAATPPCRATPFQWQLGLRHSASGQKPQRPRDFAGVVARVDTTATLGQRKATGCSETGLRYSFPVSGGPLSWQRPLTPRCFSLSILAQMGDTCHTNGWCVALPLQPAEEHTCAESS